MGDNINKNDKLQSLFKKTRIEKIMKTPVVKVYEEEDFSEVVRKFIDNNLTHLCIVNKKDVLVGLISRKYIYKAQSPRKVQREDAEYDPDIIEDGDSFYIKETLDSYILNNIMQKKPFTLNPNDTIADAILNMSEKYLGFIPIVDDKFKVLGTITDREIVDFVADIIKS